MYFSVFIYTLSEPTGGVVKIDTFIGLFKFLEGNSVELP